MKGTPAAPKGRAGAAAARQFTCPWCEVAFEADEVPRVGDSVWCHLCGSELRVLAADHRGIRVSADE